MKKCPNEARMQKKVDDKKVRDYMVKPERKESPPVKKKK